MAYAWTPTRAQLGSDVPRFSLVRRDGVRIPQICHPTLAATTQYTTVRSLSTRSQKQDARSAARPLPRSARPDPD